MLQTIDPNAAGEAVEKAVENHENVLKQFEGLSFGDAMSKISNGLIEFAFKLAIAILVFYVGRFIIRKLYNLILKMMTHRKVEASLVTFTLSLVKMVLYFILIVTVIGILGIETSSFLALFASAGVAIGMALSGTLQNFAGGVLVLLLKPYRVGDFIETQGFSGTVKEIQIFYTVINTPDNKAIIVPNGGLSTGTINNYSFEKIRRVDWSVALAYGTDYKQASKALMEILRSDDRVILDMDGKEPFVGLGELADSSINFTVRAWVRSSDYWPLFFNLNERFYTELPEQGFSFPFPQLDVHVSSE